MLNLRQYFIWTLLIVLVTILLVLGKIFGLFPLGAVAFGVLVVATAILSFYYPRQIFWLFIASLPLENIIVSPDIVPISLRPFQLIGGMLFLVLVKEFFMASKKGREKKNKKIDFPVLRFDCFLCRFFKFKFCEIKNREEYLNPLDRVVFVLIPLALLGVLFSPAPTVSLKLFLVLVSFFGLYWVSRNFIRTGRQLGEAVWFFIVSFEAVAFFSFYQLVADKLGWDSFRVMSGRINGTFTEPDWLGMYLVFLLAILLGIKYVLKLLQKNPSVFGERLRRFTELYVAGQSVFRAFRILINLEIFFALVILVLTVSRSAWLAGLSILGMHIFIVFIKCGWRESLGTVFWDGLKVFLVFIFVSLTGLSSFHLGNRAVSSVNGLQKITVSCVSDTALPAGEKIEGVADLVRYGCRHINLEEIKSEENGGRKILEVYRPDPNVEIRKNIYKTTWQQVKQHWFLGQGLGSSGVFLGKDDLGHSLNASNIFLEILVSYGLLGLLPFILIMFTPLIVGWRFLQIKAGRYGNKHQEVLAVFFLLTFFAILIPNLFNSGFLLGFFWVWLAVISGALSGLGGFRAENIS
jgi:hypothetical protein